MLKKIITGIPINIIKITAVFIVIILVIVVFVPRDSTSSGQIKTWSVAYTSMVNQPEYQEWIAEHFDLVDMGWGTDIGAQVIKELNPNILVLAYLTGRGTQEYDPNWEEEVDIHEDWFLHSIYGEDVANRIRAVIGYPEHAYYMNISQDGEYSDYLIARSIEKMEEHPYYDGIYGDNTGCINYGSMCLDGQWSNPLDNDEIPLHIRDNFPIGNSLFPGSWMYDQTEDWYNQLKSIGKMYVGNSGRDFLIGEEMTGWHCWEGFWHNRGHQLAPEYGEYWAGHDENYGMVILNEIAEYAKTGNHIMVISGTDWNDEYGNPIPVTDETAAMAHRWLNFTLCGFLLAIDSLDHSWFAWNFLQDDDASDGWWSEMDYKFGEPLDDYFQYSSSIYVREFEYVTIVVNTNKYEIGTYDGESIEPRTGVIMDK